MVDFENRCRAYFHTFRWPFLSAWLKRVHMLQTRSFIRFWNIRVCGTQKNLNKNMWLCRLTLQIVPDFFYNVFDFHWYGDGIQLPLKRLSDSSVSFFIRAGWRQEEHRSGHQKLVPTFPWIDSCLTKSLKISCLPVDLGRSGQYPWLIVEEHAN